MKGGNYMAVFSLTLYKKLDIGQGIKHDCSVSVDADSLTDDVQENFKKAMSLFNMIDALPYDND